MPAADNSDLNFQPQTYWGPTSKSTEILAKIKKGADRKRWVNEALEPRRASEIEDWMVLEKIPDSLRKAAGKIHPRFMGGEYLPDFAEHEVEIARVTLQSTTQDVFSIRARPAVERIEYRIADEYDTEWQFSPSSSLRAAFDERADLPLRQCQVR
jgi:hypothetical protein